MDHKTLVEQANKLREEYLAVMKDPNADCKEQRAALERYRSAIQQFSKCKSCHQRNIVRDELCYECFNEYLNNSSGLLGPPKLERQNAYCADEIKENPVLSSFRKLSTVPNHQKKLYRVRNLLAYTIWVIDKIKEEDEDAEDGETEDEANAEE